MANPCHGKGPVTEVEQKQGDVSDGIVFTDFAVKKVKSIVEAEGGKFLRVAVLPGGCAGFSYDFAIEQEASKDDVVFNFSGLNIVVNNMQMGLLKGSKVDYAESLQGAGLTVTNPNATKSCGCGHSFG